MAEKVTNPTRVPKEVIIVHADGRKDTVFVQPSSTVALPPGAKVENSYRERNPALRIVTV